MKTPDFIPEDCLKILRRLDTVPDGEAAPDAEAHIQSCAACANEIEWREAMRDRLRSAVKNVAAPPYLETRIRTRVLVPRRPVLTWRRWVAAAAVVVVCIAAEVAYRNGSLRLTAASREAYLQSVSSHVAMLMRVGLNDHVHCAFFRRYPPQAPTVQALAETMGPDYAGLIPIVEEKLPPDFRVMIAHQCTYHRRKFVHLVMKSDSQLLSLVIARKEGWEESFQGEKLPPMLADAGIPIYGAGVQRFQIAAFETREYLVYVISDLAQAQNTRMMLVLAPGVKGFLAKRES